MKCKAGRCNKTLLIISSISNARTVNISQFFKVGPSPSKKDCFICFSESPSKMVKDAFILS